MGNKRIKTDYPGVFYRERKRIGGPGIEKVYYVVFRRGKDVKETKVGRQFRDNMTPAKANLERGKIIEGRIKTNADTRAEEKIKVWTFLNLWEEYKSQRPPSRSLSNDDNRFKTHIAPSFGSKEPSKLVPLDIDRLRVNLLKTRSPQTVKHVIGIIKRIAAFGKNKALCQGLNFRPCMPIVDNKVTDDLNPEQLQSLLAAIDADENKIVAAMMKMALTTGMRRGELFRLKWIDIDMYRGFIRITQSKGGKAQEIPLNDATRGILAGVEQTSEYVFPGEHGGQRVSVQKASRRIRDRAGLPKTFRPMHSLRHVFASQLASSGKVDMYVLQRLLTHKSPQMTQRYAHLRDSALQAASDIAGYIIKRVEEPKLKVVNMKE